MQQVPADRVISKLVVEIGDLHRELAILRVQLELTQEVTSTVVQAPQTALPDVPSTTDSTAVA